MSDDLPADLPGGGSSSDGLASAGSSLLSAEDLVRLLAAGEWVTSPDALAPDAHAYEGHAALALDAAVLPELDSTLDLLTSSADLFDVPTLHLPLGMDDASAC